ncbi:MAG: hypothetical protein WA622_30155 [Mycobacterium sp.]|uniref:hypothetical protein n=1 Tax=Mycobacterium sp. TaxID=1785 RepID=UPI003BB6EDB0
MSPIPGIDAMDIGMWKELRDTESGGDLNHASVDLPTAQRLGQASPEGGQYAQIMAAQSRFDWLIDQLPRPVRP